MLSDAFCPTQTNLYNPVLASLRLSALSPFSRPHSLTCRCQPDKWALEGLCQNGFSSLIQFPTATRTHGVRYASDPALDQCGSATPERPSASHPKTKTKSVSFPFRLHDPLFPYSIVTSIVLPHLALYRTIDSQRDTAQQNTSPPALKRIPVPFQSSPRPSSCLKTRQRETPASKSHRFPPPRHSSPHSILSPLYHFP